MILNNNIKNLIYDYKIQINKSKINNYFSSDLYKFKLYLKRSKWPEIFDDIPFHRRKECVKYLILLLTELKIKNCTTKTFEQIFNQLKKNLKVFSGKKVQKLF